MTLRGYAVVPVLALAAMLTAPTDARADVTTACAAEISRYCPDVRKGRGRISACLVSQIGRLGPACLPEVKALRQSRRTPGSARRVFDPGFRAALPEACAAPAARFCPGMKPGEGRVFACLYARSDRVPKACSNAVRAKLN